MNPKEWLEPSDFDPEKGTVLRRPESEGNGYWVGAPSTTFDEATGDFYLVYRIRRPRGVTPDRGAEVRIAKGTNGIDFEDIWTGTKDQLQSTSIERCALLKLGSKWQFFVSYVDPHDQRWRIDRAEADRPEELDLTTTTPVLTAADIGEEGIKDPFILKVGPRYHMIVSYAIAAGKADADAMHGTADAYNTGLIRSATGMATSTNGTGWQWEGPILLPTDQGWCSYCTRISCIWYQAPFWLALYDGSADVSENYEEQLGLAFSLDLKTFHNATPHKPLLTLPQGKGALRYFDVLPFDDEIFFYYEMALPDGSHDLRAIKLQRA